MFRGRQEFAMTLSARHLPLRAMAACAALWVAGLPTVSHAACSPMPNISLGRVTSAPQLQAMQGRAEGGSLVRGTAAPISVPLTGCSETLTTSVRAERVTMSKDGQTLTLAPWLVSVDGNALPSPKDLSQFAHEFVGNVTLGLVFVPVNAPAGMRSGQYNGPLVFTFTD
jgi:hypothetical protein